MADIACEICGALTDERALSFVSDLVEEEIFAEALVCVNCQGDYSDEELIEKVENM